MTEPLNSYGDVVRPTEGGHGMDIASQRVDELDRWAIERVEALHAVRAVCALELGCGHGGQAARLARAGAQVLAIDVVDHAVQVAASMREQGIDASTWAFRCIGIERVASLGVQADVIVCQRMIHYLRWRDALDALSALRRSAADAAMLYLSASGIDSELGDGYPDRDVDVRRRFALLRQDRAEHHGITHPVCLYREGELAALVHDAGWSVRRVFRSDFGNVKLVASNER